MSFVGESILCTAQKFKFVHDVMPFHDRTDERDRRGGGDAHFDIILLQIMQVLRNSFFERNIVDIMLIQNNFRHIAMVTEITSAPDVEQKVKQLRKYWN